MRPHARKFAWILIFACLATPVAAQQVDTERLFTVFGIEVDVTSTTAAQARRVALDRARREAFGRLVEKLAAPESRERLPNISRAEFEQLVRAVQISNERSSSTRYLAEIDVTFSPPAIRELLTQAGIAYTESLGGPYLLLPLYHAGGQLRLWGEHPWRIALEAAEPRNRLILYRFPEPVIRIRAMLSPLRLDGATPGTLARIARQLDVADVVLAEATPVTDFQTGRQAVDFRGVTGPGAGVEVDGRVIARAEEDLLALLERAANRVYDAVDEAWKARTLISDRQRHRIAVLAPVRNLDDWLALRKRLERVPVLRNTEIKYIALPLSRFTIDYVGSMEQLKMGLAQARLSLTRRGERYLLRPQEQVEALEAVRTKAEKEAAAAVESSSNEEDGDEDASRDAPSENAGSANSRQGEGG